METINKNKLFFYGFIFVLLLISLFVNLGVHPLYLEEPRRALIALEMLFNKNLIVPTEFGEFYYKKPPLYNWTIIGAYKLLGNYSEWATRLVTVLSFIGMGLSIYWIGKKYVSLEFGILGGLLWLVSIDIYYYFSVLAEIDIFYSLITLLSFFTLFHFYQTRQFALLFVLTYTLGAFGTLTKGLPSIVFLGISQIVFFVYNKDFKKLFSFQHMLGIAVYGTIVGGYFYAYSQYNGLDGYFRDLWSQSSERTLLEKSLFALAGHLFTFPLEVFKNVLPASLFLIFMIKKGWFNEIKKNKLIEFCFFMFSANSIVYWLSPGTRARYVYMLYPLLILILLYFYLINKDIRRKKAFEVLVGIVMIACILATAAVPFIPQFIGINHLVIISILGVVVLSAILWLYVQWSFYRFSLFILTLVIIRFVFNFTILPSRAKIDQQAQIEKIDALNMAGIIGSSPVNVLNSSALSHTTIFYLEREIQKVVGFRGEKNLSDFYIISQGQGIEPQDYKVYYTFNSANEKRLLIKFLK